MCFCGSVLGSPLLLKTGNHEEEIRAVLGTYCHDRGQVKVGNQVSLQQTLDMAQAGGKISVLGLGHLFAPVDQPYPASLFRNLTMYTGLVNVPAYMRTLLPLVEASMSVPGDFSIADIANWCWVRYNERAEVELDQFSQLQRWRGQIEACPACARGVLLPGYMRCEDAVRPFEFHADKR